MSYSPSHFLLPHLSDQDSFLHCLPLPVTLKVHSPCGSYHDVNGDPIIPLLRILPWLLNALRLKPIATDRKPTRTGLNDKTRRVKQLACQLHILTPQHPAGLSSVSLSPGTQLRGLRHQGLCLLSRVPYPLHYSSCSPAQNLSNPYLPAAGKPVSSSFVVLSWLLLGAKQLYFGRKGWLDLLPINTDSCPLKGHWPLTCVALYPLKVSQFGSVHIDL